MLPKLRSRLRSALTREPAQRLATEGPLHAYPQTLVSLEEMSKEPLRAARPYRKTYAFEPAFISAAHEAFHADTPPGALINIGIEGWLLADDALKLYELAYFTPGNILELGTYLGLSATIMARAMADAGAGGRIDTVELDAGKSLEAQKALRGREPRLVRRVSFAAQDAVAFMEQRLRAGSKYTFAFVDHSHRHQDVKAACQRLTGLIEPGGFVLFHDYNDARNTQNDPDYGVYQGVEEGLSKEHFTFWGCFGCTGLYRKLPYS